MLCQNVSKYGLATHLALAAALPAALAQFVSAGALACTMLWVAFLAFIWILMEPSVFAGETVSGARWRVVHGMMRDPLAWFLVLAVCFAFCRWLNSDVKLAFDAEAASWAVKDPSVTFLPASSGDAGFLPFALTLAATSVILGVKHALGRNARLWFGISAGAVSSVGALTAAIYAGLDVQPFKAAALASFGATSFAGSMYALFLPLAVACGIEAEERGMTKARLVFAFAVAGNAIGAYVFLPPILSISYLSISVLVAVIALVLVKQRTNAATMARATSMLFFGVITAVFVFMVLPSADIQKRKAEGLEFEKAFTPALSDRNEALRRVAKTMWIGHPWAGVGVGAFGLQAPFCAVKEDWTVLPPEPKDGSNGYFTLIAERGIIGGLMWLVGIAFLCWFWCSRLVGAFRWQKAQDEGRSFVLNMSAVAWTGPFVLVACAADAWFSSGFPLTPLAACVVAAMPLAAASFPKVKRKTTGDEEERKE